MKFTGDVVIGLEIHVELNTKTKLFCACPTQGSDEPNSRVCQVCLGHPGSKPVVNKKAVEYAAKLALALGCKIADKVIFSRKSYFYPDMSKNFQITQYEIPLGENGVIEVSGERIDITRVHIEEDPASLVHPGGIGKSNYVLVDYNRSGNPLCEVVTAPQLRSPEQARDFMKSLITILEYLDIFSAGKNIIKADANISIRETGYTRVEIKNITGFRDIERALSYEQERQKNSPKEVLQQTRSWDSELGVTSLLRMKETEEDYGYITEPDLVPITLSADWKARLRKEIPELPTQKCKRYVTKFRLSEDDAQVISNEKGLADIFEKSIEHVDPVLAARWIRKELVRVLGYNNIELSDMQMDTREFIELLIFMQKKLITEKVGQRILEILAVKPIIVKDYIEKEGLGIVSESKELEKYCVEALSENAKAVADYRAGRLESLNFILGAVMKKSRGKADAVKVRKMLVGLIGK
ncbi:MAG: Asp-tRNA(Asn)/Glu-tRNA(Gln) amidotransferase subunit GatB [archaeon]